MRSIRQAAPRIATLSLLIALATNMLTTTVSADTKVEVPDACPQGICHVTASEDDSNSSSTSSNSNKRAPVGPSAREIAFQQMAAYRSHMRKMATYQQCLATADSVSSCQAPNQNSLARPPDGWVDADATSNAPLLSPSQAGAIAVARLRLPVTPPKVGPDPNLNKWKMAAVGYPLWVWADGPTHVGPVSDSVGGLTVSLDARLTKTVFRMGDGGTVTCVGAGTPYRNSTKPGTPSPNCGYRYEKPSLPNGNYTISAIAYWAVTWTVNGTSGVITVPTATSAQLPVGEVQVLRR